MDTSDHSFSHFSLELDQILPALFHTALEGILVCNAAGEIVLVNQRCCELFGYTEEEFIGKGVETLMPPYLAEQHPQLRKTFMEAPQAKTKGHRRYLTAQKKDESKLVVEISLNPIKLPEGDFVIAHVVDVSEQLQAENNLKENKVRLSAIIEAAVDGIITISQRGIIESANPATARLFGFTADEMIGQNVRMLMPEPDHSDHDQYLRNYQQTGKKKIIGIGREVLGKKKDGTTFPFYLSVSEVKLPERTIYTGIIHDQTQQKAAEAALKKHSEELEKRVIARTQALNQAMDGMANEIHERKLIEQKLRDAQEETEQALAKEKQLNELKSRFVSMASHEFRTPLATILSSLNLLNRYQAPEQSEKRNKHINRIRNNVHNLTGILNDFLSLSKLEEGIIEARNEHFDLAELIQELCEEMQAQAKAGQQVQSNLPVGTAFQVYSDPTLLRNILVNLLNNAVKYSPENATVQVVTEAQTTGYSITVADQGIGIPEDELKHLFERFFRARNVTHIQGTGLGLSIVRRYMDLLDGQIQFESKENIGTTISLHFSTPTIKAQ